MDTIYIEESVRTHPNTIRMVERFPQARKLVIDRYSSVFNAPGQNFRTQKNNPSLIIANKHGKKVLPTPPGYHIGGVHNFYFSHMYNCIYDCRYCFLQGMYRSANYVVFVNYNDFFEAIAESAASKSDPCWYFSGYDCDSLALEPVTQFIQQCLTAFETMPNANLEIRTKSTQIRPLLNRTALDNCVVAYSLSPEEIVKAEEHKTPSLKKRLDALHTLQSNGWKIGLRFDPLINCTNFKSLYKQLFQDTFNALDRESIHSVSLGPFRLPKNFHKKMIKLYPDSALLAAEMEQRDGLMSYEKATEQELLQFCEQELQQYISTDQYFPCVSVT